MLSIPYPSPSGRVRSIDVPAPTVEADDPRRRVRVAYANLFADPPPDCFNAATRIAPRADHFRPCCDQRVSLARGRRWIHTPQSLEHVDPNAEYTRWDLLDTVPPIVPIRTSVGCPCRCRFYD